MDCGYRNNKKHVYEIKEVFVDLSSNSDWHMKSLHMKHQEGCDKSWLTNSTSRHTLIIHDMLYMPGDVLYVSIFDIIFGW